MLPLQPPTEQVGEEEKVGDEDRGVGGRDDEEYQEDDRTDPLNFEFDE